jgi:parallel beta-helix repeat protein
VAPAAAESTPLQPTADAYVQASRPTRNYGSRTALRVDASPDRIAYLKFDVPTGADTSSAVLRIFAETSGDAVEAHAVSDDSWIEGGITYDNRPTLDGLIAATGPVAGGNWYELDVTAAIDGTGTASLALRTVDNTAIRISSREGSNPPELFVPAPPPPASASPFLVTRDGSTYTAASQTTSSSYTGSLQSVVESAVDELGTTGGGTITFTADNFDLGTGQFALDDVSNITFEGQGMDATTIVNDTNEASDTEPFDVVGADGLVVRDLAVAANGAFRSTSDALDFDNASNTTVERVKVLASRSRGIVFDGKGAGWQATGNEIRDCVIGAIPDDGIELLAAGNNTVTGCTISDVGGHGIQINKSSSGASQPNKQSNDNQILGNTIDQAGRDGVNVNSGAHNTIASNTITNSSDERSGRDGIRIESFNGITCDDNVIDGNQATDEQATQTQRYGLNIANSLCNRTVVRNNSFAGNAIGDIRDLGTDTQYDSTPDVQAPTTPTGVAADAFSHTDVDVSWSASSDDVGVDGYTVYRDGGAVATVDGATLAIRDGGATPATTHQYTVDAFDAAGNRSAQSTPAATVTTPPAPAMFTLTPTADTYVHQSNPTRNYGSSSALRVDGSPDVHGYLRFDVTGVTGSVTQATLRIFAESGTSVGHDIRAVADTSWDEGAVTYDNAPGLGATLGSSGPFSSGGYVDIDVTGYVTGDGPVSFGVSTPHTTAIKFTSREGANPPQLVITQG